MCGISGIVHFNQREVIHKQQLALLSEALEHRGPDAEGVFSDDHVSFAHRRLSIIDLSDTADQPMASADGNIQVVFNGEIYNHAEIRKELRKHHAFKTNHSDTEVIINAYAHWGISCLERFVGMFALAIYDKKRKRVYLVRDRLGKKPIYYYISGANLYFSSEIQPFFHANLLQKDLNVEAIYHYLTFLTVLAPNTFFNHIYKLEPGHYIEIGPDGHRKFNYWDVSAYLNQERAQTFQKACESTQVLLDKSMVWRNVSDVPICVALSGGLDSSLNLHHSASINKDIFSTNISFRGDTRFDESAPAEKLSRELGVPFIGRKIDEDDFEHLIEEYLGIQKDVPMGDPNAVLVYLLSKIARENGAKVLLVGEGGDEIGGYPSYIRYDREFRKYRLIPEYLTRYIRYLPERFVEKFDFFHKGHNISRRHIHGFTEYEKKRMWRGERNFNSYDILLNLMQEIRDDMADSFLRKISNIEYKLRLPELILARIDYPSMACGVEARSPFMDHQLIEYSCTLPFGIKMKDGAKSILKAVAQKKLPPYVINHPKVGFGMLLDTFFKTALPLWFKEIVTGDSPLKSFISSESLKFIYETHLKSHKNGYKIWILFALHRWLEKNSF